MQRISPYSAGSTLYVPSTAWHFMERILEGKYSFLPSVTLCLEDAIREDEVPEGMACIARFLEAARGVEGLPFIFVRPRHCRNLADLLEQGGLELVDGYVLPKFDAASLPAWEDCLRHVPAWWLPTLETADAFDPQRMRQLAESLRQSPCRERILVLRVGGNDLQQLLGVRRSRRHTLYEGPLGTTLAMLATTFLPLGFALSAPAFEILDDADLLLRELELDILHGYCGKTAIHPEQMCRIRDAFRVSPEDVRAAQAILSSSKAVFRLDNAMCEPATHSRWAQTILERREIFGETASDAS